MSDNNDYVDDLDPYNFDNYSKDELLRDSHMEACRRNSLLYETSKERIKLDEILRIHRWTRKLRVPNNNNYPMNLDEVKPGNTCYMILASIQLSILNLWAAVINLLMNGWAFEQFGVIFVCLLSTMLFSNISNSEGKKLASQLDFHFLATSLIYLVNFGARSTLGRRDLATSYVGSVKAVTCNICIALLLWNRDRPRPRPEFADEVVRTLEMGTATCFAMLTLPTWNRTRHYFTREGLVFRQMVRRRLINHRREYTRFQCQIHHYLEELKMNDTLSPSDTNRVTDYLTKLQTYVEQVTLVKEYRTTNIARSFVRGFILVCPAMYGVYFSYVAGNSPDTSADVGNIFPSVLAIMTVVLLLLLVNMERAMEDPCTTPFIGDSIRIKSEMMDVIQRLQLIRHFCSAEGKLHYQQIHDELVLTREEEHQDVF